jgi:ABC-type multidrug transport system fused ATPase/permease subunit
MFKPHFYRADLNGEDPGNDDLVKNLGIYAALGAGGAVFQIAMDLTFLLSCAKASKLIHEKLLFRIMRSPMAFFDTNPMGRILNRFSSDIDVVDGQIPFQVNIFLFKTCIKHKTYSKILANHTKAKAGRGPFIKLSYTFLF